MTLKNRFTQRSLSTATCLLLLLSGDATAQSQRQKAQATTETNGPGFRGVTGQGTSAALKLPVEWNSSENIAWKTPLPGPGHSSPVVFGDHIDITAYSGFFVPDQPGVTQKDMKRHLLCLDRKTGKEVWRASNIKQAWNTPLVVTNVDGKLELIVATQGSIQSYHPETGKQLWTCATDIKWLWSPVSSRTMASSIALVVVLAT